MTSANPSKDPSTPRLVTGLLVLAAALIGGLSGFFRLASALETQGYGSTAVRDALIWLGAAGGALGAGISLLIWEFSVRLARRTGLPS